MLPKVNADIGFGMKADLESSGQTVYMQNVIDIMREENPSLLAYALHTSTSYDPSMNDEQRDSMFYGLLLMYMLLRTQDEVDIMNKEMA